MTSKTGPRRLVAAERRRQVLDLRRAGHTYETIAKRVGISYQRAFQVVKEELAKLNAKCQQSVEEYRRQDLERLDQLQAAVWDKAMTGDVKAIGAAVLIARHRAALLGLNAPARLETKAVSEFADKTDRELVEEATRLGVPVPPELLEPATVPFPPRAG